MKALMKGLMRGCVMKGSMGSDSMMMDCLTDLRMQGW